MSTELPEMTMSMIGLSKHRDDRLSEIDAQVERYRKILESGEPVFLLRGQDKLADKRVRDWAAEATLEGVSWEKIDRAWKIAAEMRIWPTKKLPD